MKASIGDIRAIVREEYLRGVPEFVIRQATDNFIEEIKSQVIKYLLVHRSRTPIEREEAIAAMSEHLEDLEEEINEILDQKLYAFIQSI